MKNSNHKTEKNGCIFHISDDLKHAMSIEMKFNIKT